MSMNKKRKWGIRLAVLLLGALTAGILFLSGIEEAQAPTEKGDSAMDATGAAENATTLNADAAITQIMRFRRCGHSVERRIEAGTENQGLTFTRFREKYPDWTVTAFSESAAAMEKEPELFCPMHHVLSAGDSGEIVMSQNRYGDGMAVEKVLGRTLSEMPEEKREQLIYGIGFDTKEDAEAWLAAD